MRTVIVFDTETTGLTQPSCAELKSQPRIIEIGAAKVEVPSGKVIATLTALVNPGEPIPEIITKITGITNEELSEQPAFKEHLPALRVHFTGSIALIAHNAPFDRALLDYELARAKVTDFPMPPETICTVSEFNHIFGRNMKLTELYEHFCKKELQQTHRALDDVEALVEALTAAKFWETM